MKFAHFYDGRSHQFDADPSVTDFVIGFRNAVPAQKRKDPRPSSPSPRPRRHHRRKAPSHGGGGSREGPEIERTTEHTEYTERSDRFGWLLTANLTLMF
jgi:hypothetical protein